MSDLYVGMGDDPVGRPKTKGFSGVGAKSLILHTVSVHYRRLYNVAAPFTDVVGNVVADGRRIVPDD